MSIHLDIALKRCELSNASTTVLVGALTATGGEDLDFVDSET